MTAVKGLLEALVLIVIAAMVAAAAAGIWIAVGTGDFGQRLGICLLVLGALASVTGSFTRLGSSDAYAWFGHKPERGSVGGGRVLTNVGLFLFVAIPLFVAGAVLAS
jgi:hypothetical protein